MVRVYRFCEKYIYKKNKIMSVTIDGLPIYNATIDMEGDDTGMLRVSLVDSPAVQSDFLTFSRETPVKMFSVENEEKRLVYGVLMRADFPIYRNGPEGGYYIVFQADTIRMMAEKYLLEGRQNEVNLMHKQNSSIEGADMVQMFIKDTERGVNPTGFEDIADGSLFAEYHITNDEVWEQIKDGTFKGFSIEINLLCEPVEDRSWVQEIVDELDGAFRKMTNNFNKHISMSKWEKFKKELAKILAEFVNITTDKGILAWEGDEDLKAGMDVFVEGENGEKSPAPDGDYVTEDGKTIVVVGGKVSEIKDNKAEVEGDDNPDNVEAAEEKPNETPEETPEGEGEPEKKEKDLEQRVAELEKIVDTICDYMGIIKLQKETITKLEARIAALESKPASASAHEIFEKEIMPEGSRMSKAARVASALKK